MDSQLITLDYPTLHKQLGSIPDPLIISDPSIWKLHAINLNLQKTFAFLPPPKNTKSINTYTSAINHFLSKPIHRQCHLISLGGGSISDLSGFVASTLLRGIPWSAIPTTLLSMIDSSIGGKVGLDFPSGKNQVGSFHKPTNIFLCPKFLETLPPPRMEKWHWGIN